MMESEGRSMQTYFAEKRQAVPEASYWETANFAGIKTYPWGGVYRPEAAAALCCCEDSLVLRMCALERRDYLRLEETGLSGFVHEDSCMEFFFCPLSESLEYINIEINPAGAAHIAVGKDRHSRKRLKSLADADEFRVTPFRRDIGEENEEWGFTAQISFGLIARLLRIKVYTPPFVLPGNFYICGDKTPVPHYGVWNPIDLPAPDYHRPEFFGRIQFTEMTKD